LVFLKYKLFNLKLKLCVQFGIISNKKECLEKKNNKLTAIEMLSINTLSI